MSSDDDPPRRLQPGHVDPDDDAAVEREAQRMASAAYNDCDTNIGFSPSLAALLLRNVIGATCARTRAHELLAEMLEARGDSDDVKAYLALYDELDGADEKTFDDVTDKLNEMWHAMRDVDRTVINTRRIEASLHEVTNVVDFGVNPSRETLVAHGFNDSSPEYEAMLAPFRDAVHRELEHDADCWHAIKTNAAAIARAIRGYCGTMDDPHASMMRDIAAMLEREAVEPAATDSTNP